MSSDQSVLGNSAEMTTAQSSDFHHITAFSAGHPKPQLSQRTTSCTILTSEGTWEVIERGQTAEQPVEMRYPESAKAVPLTGPSGTELILVRGRASSHLDANELHALWLPAPRLPKLSELRVLRVDCQGVSVEQRGHGLGDPVDLPDAETVVQGHLESLRRALRQNANFFEAIAFCHQ